MKIIFNFSKGNNIRHKDRIIIFKNEMGVSKIFFCRHKHLASQRIDDRPIFIILIILLFITLKASENNNIFSIFIFSFSGNSSR